MPGTDLCGRCGTSLRIATAVIDVQPPRAGRLSKRIRRVMPRRPSGYYDARDAMLQARDEFTGRVVSAVPRLPPAPVVWRLVIPGWSYFYLGQRGRGHLALWGWLAFLLPGLFFFGTTLGSILLGLAFSVHSSAALDIVSRTMQPAEGVVRQMIRGMGVSIVLFVAVYWPAGWLVTRVADAHGVMAAASPFDEGDVVLVNHWRKPLPGRVVLYNIPDFRQRPAVAHGVTYYNFEGERIDRVLAGPGDRVRWAGGELFVNGKPSPLKPLAARWVPGPMEFAVPADQYLILPSTTPQVRNVQDPVLWHVLGLVPREDIVGQVYLRSHPLGRFGAIR
ncbi:MAG TPA: S26 family signal peptidase [Tepidisphaeraceae bacterium]